MVPGLLGTFEQVVQIILEIPMLKIEVELQLNLDETVWNIKNNVVKTIASELQNSLNFSFYLPSSATKAAKYLDEDRTLREYNLTNGSLVQLIPKRRIYKTTELSAKKLREINTKVSRKKIISYIEREAGDKVAKLLSKGLDPNFVDPDLGECPFTLSVTLKHSKEIIALLVETGAHLDYRNRQGWTAMHKAAQIGNLEAIQTLLSFGASPNYRDLDGMTPLYMTLCQGSHPDCVKELLKNYALLGIRDKDGNTEIHQVCLSGRVQHLELLITYGADMDSLNNLGNTPLHMCVTTNQEDCARLLLFRGADKHIKNHLNQEPSDLAKFHKHEKLRQVIESHRAQDVVISNEIPIYNERSRLTLKRSDRSSLMLSKMSQLSMSTPYLHQSITNINWDWVKKPSNGRNSLNSEDNSTGSADQQFEFDADVASTSGQESRAVSLPSNYNTPLAMVKTLRDKQTAPKFFTNKPTTPVTMSSIVSTPSSGKTIFKRQGSADRLDSKPPKYEYDSGIFDRRQSYGNTLNSHSNDIYMNEAELEQQFNETQTVKRSSKTDYARRVSLENSKERELSLLKLEKPPNSYGILHSTPVINLNQNLPPIRSTLKNETYLNAKESSRLSNGFASNFPTNAATFTLKPPNNNGSRYFTNSSNTNITNGYTSTSTFGDNSTTLPPKSRPQYGLSPVPDSSMPPQSSAMTSKLFFFNPSELSSQRSPNPTACANGTLAKSFEVKTLNRSDFSTAGQNKPQAASPKAPTFSFIPPPPVFPSNFKTAASLSQSVAAKSDNPTRSPVISPPLPPPPANFSCDPYPTSFPLPPPPYVAQNHHQNTRSVDAMGSQGELLAAIMKRRNALEQQQ